MTDEPEKKIIIDEDWKSQVEREREQMRDTDGETPAADDRPDAGGMPQDVELPPASFGLLVSMMATQAMAAMGQLADPATGKPEINLQFAKYHIDLLAVLQEKTKGNLDEEEAPMLEATVHELRMMFVQIEAMQRGTA